jgi:hypothetical protein
LATLVCEAENSCNNPKIEHVDVYQNIAASKSLLLDGFLCIRKGMSWGHPWLKIS